MTRAAGSGANKGYKYGRAAAAGGEYRVFAVVAAGNAPLVMLPIRLKQECHMPGRPNLRSALDVGTLTCKRHCSSTICQPRINAFRSASRSCFAVSTTEGEF